MVCVCGELFDASICVRGGYIIQRHTEIRDLGAEILQVVCTDYEVAPNHQEATGEVLPKGANKAPDARLDIRARSFWAREQSSFFHVRVCHPKADSYKDLTPEQIYKLHDNDKKRLYSSRVLEVERGTFTPLVFTTTGGIIINNYSPKWRWLAVDIYRAVKQRGKYQPLATDTEVNSCFSIY